jgi:hypothetical protein
LTKPDAATQPTEMLGYVYKIVAGRPEARGFALEGRGVEAHLAADGSL